MVDIVNLRQARKRKRRGEKDRIAEANRFSHGRSGAEKEEARLTARLEAARLEGHRRQPSGDGEETR